MTQKFIKPGRWLIDGYDVIRAQSGVHRRCVDWWWISKDGVNIVRVNTLTDARAWIRKQS